ncbi:MAG TPA: M48 family metalloprotease [Rhizomicrobium sp.]|nr:M48 family metalloprotease [Rhizomicrobium sp.]
MSNSHPAGAQASGRPALIRKLSFAAGVVAAFMAYGLPAYAQNNSQFALRDTETEEMLKSYEMPLARAAGLDLNLVHVYMIGDMSINAFATQPEDIFINAGILLWLKRPNELVGVMAHETGHISAGHLSRFSTGIQKAEIPMLLSLLIGVAAMIAGAGQAGMVIMGMGQSIAMGELTTFTRVQESTADQIAMKLLNATHQSPKGMMDTFERFAQEDAQHDVYYRPDPFASNHPVDQDRVSALQDLADASPYYNVQDPPEVVHTFEMVQAKLAGFMLPVNEVMDRYPVSNTSETARYARAMAYMRKPDFKAALAEIDSLIKDEPNNPYFYEVRGQIYVSMAKPELGIPDYQKCVDLKPSAPQLRLGLATAQLATENPAVAGEALKNLKAAAMVEDDDPGTWYETAQAYSDLNNVPMANLSTAELYYAVGDMQKAIVFATRARPGLSQGTPDWQRANDIIGAAGPLARQQRGG